jgi:hypothetical protein
MSIFKNKNVISIQGGGGGNEGSGDNPGKSQCCDQPPTPPGPPDTYWVWPPYVKNIAPNGYGNRWFQRDFLTENLFIPPEEIQYTLLYIEKLKDEYGGTVSSVWAPRANFIIAPGNGFFNNLTIIGDPQGWKASEFLYSRAVKRPDGSSLTPFMLEGKLQLRNLCKIEKAGGYIFEIMKYINQNNLAGDGSTKYLGNYASIFSGSEFVTQAEAPTVNGNSINSGYSFDGPNSEGYSIIEAYLKKLVAVTGDDGYINVWNSLECTNNITAPPENSSSSPQNWGLDELLEAIKDPWLAWNINGGIVDEICGGIGGAPVGNFNIMDPGEVGIDVASRFKSAVVKQYHFITGRTYYINICNASKIYAIWKQLNNPNYDFNPDIDDYPSLRSAIRLEKLKEAYNNPTFKQYLISNNKLVEFVKPYRAAIDDAFTDFTAWYTSYGNELPLKSWKGNGTISINETMKVDGDLKHRISWEDAGLIASNPLSGLMAPIFGSSLLNGPTHIDSPSTKSSSDPVCLQFCVYTYISHYSCCTEWSPIIRSGPVMEAMPDITELNKWIFNGDTATWKVYTTPDFSTNNCSTNIPEPTEELPLSTLPPKPCLPISVYRTGGTSGVIEGGSIGGLYPGTSFWVNGCGHDLVGTISSQGDTVTVTAQGPATVYSSIEAQAVDACGRCVFSGNNKTDGSTAASITVSYSSCAIGFPFVNTGIWCNNPMCPPTTTTPSPNR